MSQIQDPHSQYTSSELDSQSDSDWLDIASSRESDDNDSVPSDHDDVHSMPLSRRSSLSLGSSGEGDVEAWEGFVEEDSADERLPSDEPGMYPVPPSMSVAQLDGLDSNLEAVGDLDTAEDERVKEGLEQSLISTLSGSRSSSAGNTGSTHASLRDLRLSFPDPLTSSKDNLPLSRSNSPPTDEILDSLTSMPTSVGPVDTSTIKPESEPDIVTPTPEVSQTGNRNIDIDIVLYGFSPESKWNLIKQLLRKAASQRTLSSTFVSASASCFFFEPQSEAVQLNGIAVHDCTQGGSIHFTSSNPDRPSLAVVFLPCDSISALPKHTLYLPIFVDVQSPDTVASSPSLRGDAERTWRMLSVPPNKTLLLRNRSATPLLSSSELESVTSFRVHRAFQRLVSRPKKQPAKTLSDHLSSVPAVTFFALVSIVMSFTINTFFRAPQPTPVSLSRVQVSTSTWGITSTQLNGSTPQPTPMSQQGNALIASSLKDFALAIINPPSTALSVASQSSALPVTSKAMSHRETRPPARGPLNPPSTDVILPPAPATSVISILTKPTVSVPLTNKKERMTASGSALSIRMVDSVSEVLEATVKTALDAVHNDLKELIDAMDDLMRAIQDQTKKAIAKSTITADSIREHVKYRNNKARGKAREIKEKSEKLIQSAGEHFMETTWSMKLRGEKFVMFAQEHIKDRTTVAKEKAHSFRERMINSEAWRVYVAGHEEWARTMLEQEAVKKRYKKWTKSCEKRIQGRRDRRGMSKGCVCAV